ncbi:MAG: response regulator transcription factor [Spirochaetia bacterium]|nr:response regulator transcription factor [Spirochaetia bacterium]
MPSFLILDDHAIVRKGIIDTLARAYPDHHIREAADAQSALASLREETPDMVILDISIPGTSGLEFLKAARQLRPRLKVLVFSMHSEDEYAIRALKAGASGYLVKGASPEDLLTAVGTVLDGATFASPQITARLVAEVRNDPGRPLHESLSNREFEILRMLARGKSVREITWELALSENTVRTYRARVLAKMDMKTNSELIRYALDHNLV